MTIGNSYNYAVPSYNGYNAASNTNFSGATVPYYETNQEQGSSSKTVAIGAGIVAGAAALILASRGKTMTGTKGFFKNIGEGLRSVFSKAGRAEYKKAAQAAAKSAQGGLKNIAGATDNFQDLKAAKKGYKKLSANIDDALKQINDPNGNISYKDAKKVVKDTLKKLNGFTDDEADAVMKKLRKEKGILKKDANGNFDQATLGNWLNKMKTQVSNKGAEVDNIRTAQKTLNRYDAYGETVDQIKSLGKKGKVGKENKGLVKQLAEYAAELEFQSSGVKADKKSILNSFKNKKGNYDLSLIRDYISKHKDGFKQLVGREEFALLENSGAIIV